MGTLSRVKHWWDARRRRATIPATGDSAVTAAVSQADPADDAALVARTDDLNRNADTYWQGAAQDPSWRRHVLNKPFSTFEGAPAQVYRLGLVLAELHAGPGHVVLDFGAGSCWLSSCLNRQGVATIAVDVSAAALELGRELFSMDQRHRPEAEPRFLQYDGHRLPLADQSVDRIVAFDALHHVPNLDEVLAELARVLRVGGRAVLAEPGQGHSHSEESLREMERYDVLENDLDIADLERRALNAGFTGMQLKPYADPEALIVSVEHYKRLMAGDVGAFPMAIFAQSLRQVLIAVLSKGDEIVDSHRPRLMRADIRRVGGDGPVRGKGGASVPISLQIRNAGDTLWRHEMTAVGGYVTVSGHILGDDGRPVTSGFFRTTLPRSVPPGDEIQLTVDLPLPTLESGRCRVRIDLANEQVAWFSELGSDTLDLDVELDAAAEAGGSHGLAARIDGLPSGDLSARPGDAVAFSVRIENVGMSAWPTAVAPTPGAVSLGAHLLDMSGRVLDADYVHLPLPHDVPPGGRCEMRCVGRAPLEPGRYRIQLDLVLETICWFGSHGSETPEVGLVVLATDEG